MYRVMEKTSPKQIWDKLELGRAVYVHDIDPKVVSKKQKLYGPKMKKGLDLVEHINIFNQFISDFGKVDMKIDDEDRAIIFLCSLPGLMSTWLLH